MDPYYEKLAPLIGHVVIEHGNLEGDAGRMLARLNGKSDDVSAAVFAAKNSFNEKVMKARQLVQLKVEDAELKSEFERVLDEMDRVNKARNKYIHSEYLPEVDASEEITGAYYRQIKQMGDIVDVSDSNSEIAVHRVDEPEIRALVADMSALGVRIRIVSEAYFDSLPYEPPGPPNP